MSAYGAREIFQPKNLLAWNLFCIGAGMVNAGAVMASGRFITHVSGTVTQIGLALSALDLAIDCVVIVVAFVTGAGLAVLLVGDKRRNAPASYVAPLAATCALLVLAWLGGQLGLFGAFGSTEDTPTELGLIAMLACSMGLQNAGVALATGNAVRTTHLTGPSTDLGVSLARAFKEHGEEVRKEFAWAGLRAVKVLAFTTGGVLGALIAGHVGFVVFGAAAGVLATATGLAFVFARRDVKAPAKDAAPPASARPVPASVPRAALGAPQSGTR